MRQVGEQSRTLLIEGNRLPPRLEPAFHFALSTGRVSRRDPARDGVRDAAPHERGGPDFPAPWACTSRNQSLQPVCELL